VRVDPPWAKIKVQDDVSVKAKKDKPKIAPKKHKKKLPRTKLVGLGKLVYYDALWNDKTTAMYQCKGIDALKMATHHNRRLFYQMKKRGKPEELPLCGWRPGNKGDYMPFLPILVVSACHLFVVM
jgi:hypothetical protein